MKIGWVRNEKKVKNTGSLSLWSALIYFKVHESSIGYDHVSIYTAPPHANLLI